MAFAKHSSTKSLVRTGTRLTGTFALLLLCLPALFFAPVQAQPNAEAFLRPGELVVSQSKLGQVLAINADGKTRSLASGLKTPRSVLVLEDETILIAEGSANQISVVGGPYGKTPSPLVAIERPEGMALAPDGEVYITSLDGSVSRLNVVSRSVTKVASGFTTPIGIAYQGQLLYVVDAGRGLLASVTLAGEKLQLADKLGQPTGVAVGPDQSIYVADFTGDRIMKVTQGEGDTLSLSEFAKVKAPVYLSLIPSVVRANEPFSIAVTMADGVIQFDANGTPTGKPVNMAPGAEPVGISTVPGGPLIPAPTTVPGGAGVPTVSGSGSTVAPTTTRPELGPDLSDGGGSAGLALLAGVVILCAGAGLIAYFAFSRREGSEFGNDLGGFGEMEKGVNLAAAVGPCAAIESRLAEVDQAIRGMQEQWSSAERRQKEAAENATKAEVREETARDVLAATRKKLEAEEVAQKASGKDAEPENKRVSLDDLNLQTEEGWAALRAFGAKEISAVELRKRWDALGEKDAISAVLGSGQAMKPEERAAVEELDAAKEERLHAERDVSEAADELKRLDERVSQVKKQQVEVKRALDACHAEQKKGELQAATDAKQAFADAEEAATLAAFALRSDDVAAAFAAGAPDTPVAKSDPKSDPKEPSKSDPKADPKAAPKADPKAGAKADPKEPSKSDPKSDPKADAKADPKEPSKAANGGSAPRAIGSATTAPGKPGSGATGSAKAESAKRESAKGEAGAPTTSPLSETTEKREAKLMGETVPGDGRPTTVQPGIAAHDASKPADVKPSTPPKPAASAGPVSGGPGATASSAAGSDPAKAAAQAAAKKAVQQAIADAGSAAPPAKPASPSAAQPADSQVRDAPPVRAPRPPEDLPAVADEPEAPNVDPAKKRSIFGRKPDPDA